MRRLRRCTSSAPPSPAGADLTVSPGEPISPELVLVSPELRTLAIGALGGSLEHSFGYVGAPPHSGRQFRRGVFGRVVLYAAWQSLVGALIGISAFAAFTALAVAVAPVAR